MTPHAWTEVGAAACALPDCRLDSSGVTVHPACVRRLQASELHCRRCGIRVSARHALAVDRVEGWRDCDVMLAEAVMLT